MPDTHHATGIMPNAGHERSILHVPDAPSLAGLSACTGLHKKADLPLPLHKPNTPS